MSFRAVLQEKPIVATVPASAYDLGQKIRAAIAAGAFWFGLVLVVGWALLVVAALVDQRPADGLWLAVPGLAFVVGVVQGCRLGIRWTVAAASRAWAVDDADRAYRRRLETGELEKEWLAAAMARGQVIHGDDHDGDPATFTDAQRLDLVALEILQRHYLEGLPVSREAMTEAGLCTQPEWNLVSQAMQKVGLKEKRTLRRDLGFADAWLVWREAVRVDEGYVWAMNVHGNWKALERVD